MPRLSVRAGGGRAPAGARRHPAPVRPEGAEEIFGPVAPVQVYDDIVEALDIINASEYGLSVSIL
ncbi:aldehyde dehydrogenase family protein, partial [Streptomyces sp. NPDC052077]|uniref:aldehyde dehydrogenase family protein n=1 Tax=Streptomyces sp. NPDC052077 TaxID=3154757 RepID=UPI00341A4115